MVKFLLRFFKTNDLEAEFLRRYGEDIHADDVTPEQQDKIFGEMCRIEGIQDFIRSILKKDLFRYFNSPKEGQDIVRGARLRTLWILKSLKKKEQVEYTNPRYN